MIEILQDLTAEVHHGFKSVSSFILKKSWGRSNNKQPYI